MSNPWENPLDCEGFAEVSEVKFEHPKRFAAYVIGDSAYPWLQPGDLTIWHVDSNPMYGRIVLAQRKGDHGCAVKELIFDTDENTHILKALNPSYEEHQEKDGFGVIARLVGVVLEHEGATLTIYQDKGVMKKHLAFRMVEA